MQDEFREEKIRLEELNPWSTWFSYGSNLYSPDFESKMKKYGSNLSLLCPLRVTLRGYERTLDNESRTRGLAYALHELEATNGSESFVEGIIHNVPVADLPAFLRFEGVLDKSYRVKPKGKRTYDIRRVTANVHSKGEPEVSCFTLLGCCRVAVPEQKIQIERYYEQLVDYVRTAMKGAVCFGIDVKPFQEDLCKIEECIRICI